MTDFVDNIGGTAYSNITCSYYDFNKFRGGVKDPVVNRVSFGGRRKGFVSDRVTRRSAH